MPTDKEIFDLIVAGDDAGFRHLYKAHFGMVKYMVLNNSGSEQAASDLFQEVAIVLYEKARDGKLTMQASLKTIVYSIARNLWLKELRGMKRSTSIKDKEKFIAMPEDDAVDEEQYARQHHILEHALKELGEPCKTLLTQFYYFKKSLQELAEQLNYNNTDTVKTQKYKCLKRLKLLAVAAN